MNFKVINVEFKWAEDLLQKKINEKIVENLMEKLNKHSDVVCEVIDNEIVYYRILDALTAFECNHGIIPNKIIMGYKLYGTFENRIRYKQAIEEDTNMLEVVSEFYGVPVEVDYDKPNRLEIGHMIKLS